jgi:branched-chain amino acid transport system ATP-binding protein
VKRGLVLCRERHPVFRESTVDENLRIAGFLRSWRDLRRGMEEAFIVFPALTALRRQKAGLLSGGQQQMLSMAMALVARPRLLLLDEPLLGLAPIVQRQIVDALVHIRQADVTVLVAEQYARPIFPIVDRAYVIENGSLVMTGPGRELMDDPNIRSAYLGV